MESCAQESQTCFVQICIQNKISLSGSQAVQSSAALTAYQSQHLAPWTAEQTGAGHAMQAQS